MLKGERAATPRDRADQRNVIRRCGNLVLPGIVSSVEIGNSPIDGRDERNAGCHLGLWGGFSR